MDRQWLKIFTLMIHQTIMLIKSKMENSFIKWFRRWWKWFFCLRHYKFNNPKQLFSIKNDPVNKIISHWDSDGGLNNFSYANGTIAEFDYRKLGETWSTPRIIRIKVDSTNDGSTNPVDKWVAVFGAVIINQLTLT